MTSDHHRLRRRATPTTPGGPTRPSPATPPARLAFVSDAVWPYAPVMLPLSTHAKKYERSRSSIRYHCPCA